MIPVPHTYSEWAKIIDIFKDKQNDTEVLIAMKSGTLEWQSGVADRFSKRLIDAINLRMNDASEKIQKNLNNSRGAEGAIVQALLGLRKEMCFLAQAVNIQVLPEEHRKQYLQLVLDQANQMQKSLEDSAKRDRSGKMGSIVRNHKVNAF